MYHPDKTDNELLKAKFALIKEAYEVLSNPTKRQAYDLGFDNFSYKKQEHLTPGQLLQKIKTFRTNTAKLDPHRMDLDRLEFEITEILSERNIHTLSHTEDTSLVHQFIEELLQAARPLSSKQFKTICEQLYPFASEDTREKIRQSHQLHTWQNRWNTYKIVFAIAAAILLCLLIFLLGK